MLAAPASAAEWFVAAGGSGNGTKAAPFGRIQDGLNAAMPGDTVTVGAGTYSEALRTPRGGLPGMTIRLHTLGPRGSVVVTTATATVFRISHPHLIVEGLVFDGGYGAFDTVLVSSAAHFLTLRNVEVRRSSKDLIDMGAPHGVLIEGSLLHHALNATGGRTDAHAVAAAAVQDLTIRDTEIHTFSGDGLQVDPSRSAPGWSRVTLESSRVWLAPLPAPENGFAAGIVPGENAVDTKANNAHTRATIVIRDTIVWGFRGGLIGNMAAFNLKEKIDATVDRVTVYDSEIAFRLRGPAGGPGGAWVAISNAVVYNTTTAFRYEDNIENLRLWNCTVGSGVTRAFQAASSSSGGLDVRNLLVLGGLPKEAAHSSNRAVNAAAFVDAATHNYALAPGSPAIDAGTSIAAVVTDRAGLERPQGAAYDVGAFEWTPPGAVDDVVRYAADAGLVTGHWQRVIDTTAAGGARLWHPNENASAIAAQGSPTHYFEVSVNVEAGRPYRLWLRGRSQNDSGRNDSVWVQFSGTVGPTGKPLYRIGTTSAARVTLMDCTGCGLSAWGWQDNGYGLNVLGPEIRFAAAGEQFVRVQTREDGFSIDQIVLSPSTYLAAAPGATKNDTTILPLSP
jgi:hypothetical protein